MLILLAIYSNGMECKSSRSLKKYNIQDSDRPSIYEWKVWTYFQSLLCLRSINIMCFHQSHLICLILMFDLSCFLFFFSLLFDCCLFMLLVYFLSVAQWRLLNLLLWFLYIELYFVSFDSSIFGQRLHIRFNLVLFILCYCYFLSALVAN